LGTGTSPGIAAAMMIRGLVAPVGVFAPEAVIPAETYILELEKRFMPPKITMTRNFSAPR
jgi:saccharopine dehydrogenase-like NADP-dependent oxidoreductase